MQYKNTTITKNKHNGYYVAYVEKNGQFQRLMSDTLQGIKKLITEA